MQPNDAIYTYTGKWVQPLNPDPETFCIEDIAHSLAAQCRFTGHTTEFYSVAQHSVLVSYIVDREFALEGLMHDASEAYLSDIARPVKRNGEFGRIYMEVEEALMQAISNRFKLRFPVPKEVKDADGAMLGAEMRDLMPTLVDAYFNEGVAKQKVVPWSPKEAERHFLSRYSTLTGEDVTIPKKPTTTLWETKRTQRIKD